MTLPNIPRSASRLLVATLSLLAFAFLATPAVQAQGICTALRTNDLSTFVTTSSVTPDYFPGRALGITAGLDWTAHHGRYLATSFEVRANRTASNQLIERSITFGPRIQTNIGNRFHPYANYFIGGGTIVFLNNSTGYHEDRSPVHSLGGGFELDLPHHLATRVDYQNQAWDLGRIGTSTTHQTFSPTLVSVGVQYHIPFRPRMSRTY